MAKKTDIAKEHPYFNEIKGYEDLRGKDIASTTAWRNMAFLLGFLIVLSVAGNIYQGTQSKIRVKVYREDRFGGLYYMGEANQPLVIKNNNIGNFLINYIVDLRSVPYDKNIKQMYVDYLQAFSSQSLFSTNVIPIIKSRYKAGQNIYIDVDNAFPINSSTWEIDWTETDPMNNKLKFKGTIGYFRKDPVNQSQSFQYTNPLGIVITDINIAPELK